MICMGFFLARNSHMGTYPKTATLEGVPIMGPYRKLWFTLIAVLAVTFALLGFYGGEVYRQAPPIPGQVVTTDGKPLFGRDDILDGQTAWQSVGGMQLGSVWGHGAYQAPDWTADWLHRELTAWLDLAAREQHGRDYAQLDAGAQAALRAELKAEYRANRSDAATDTLAVSPRRARAMAQTAAYYDQLFSDAPALHRSRENFAMKENTLPDAARRTQLTHFFFWTAWAAATEREGKAVTYTNNWPHEPLIDNVPSAENVMWSILSVVVLLAGIGFLVWAWAFLRGKEDDEPLAPAKDPLTTFALTPSQRALGKYLFLVVALFGFQVLLGAFTAHYTVEGQKFYGAGFFYGERTHLTVMEYWRWWIVHLWVEGFFEVFATTALAFIFSTLGLVSRRMATTASLASASLFMLGGIPGTFHHLYFAGTTTPVMAIGASFSALEVVPLIVLGHEAWENWRLKTRAPWMENLKWPLMCFVAVAFWNMLGAGVFGFMINPPVSLYYIQGLNTTPVHAHAALFGVYGFLALGFTLLVLRYIRPQYALSPGLMKLAFWGMNLGLALMIFTSLLPVGLIQFHASVSEGMWYARSEGFMQQELLQNLRWGRTFGDVVFLLGALAIVMQVILGLLSGKPALAEPRLQAKAARG